MSHHSGMKAGKGKARTLARFGLIAVGLLSLVGVLPGSATATLPVIEASEVGYQFVGSPIGIEPGARVTFNNPAGSPALHNVYATSKGPDGKKLFYSGTIPPGSQSPVAGTEYLEVGSYPFVCTLHPGMAGVLQVAGAGQPVGRPSAKISIPGQRLAAVVRRGALKVKVSSRSGATGIGVVVEVGGRKVGTVRSVSVGRGASRSITVTLTPQGKARLQGEKAARFTARTSLPFGSPSTARKAIR